MKRVGLIIPSINCIVEDEMLPHLPSGVKAHVTRLRMTGPHSKPHDALLPLVQEAAGALADAGCDMIVFHCTANSTASGLEGEQDLLGALTTAGAPIASSTATALRRACAALGSRSMTLITPYSQSVTDHEAVYLADIGQRVALSKGHNLDRLRYASTPSAFWIEKGVEAREPAADVTFLSCANISAIPAIAPLEAAIGRPVITSNQIVLWDIARQLDLPMQDARLGRLFQHTSAL
ncbi:MAG: maleate cis-trans isomerase [Hyphomicrobiales bacterium]|nr:maleate cis-trans isomerase [Hyphomicrobiales bacterium]